MQRWAAAGANTSRPSKVGPGRLEAVLGAGELDGPGGAADHGDRRGQQAVVRSDQDRLARRRPRRRPPAGRCRPRGRPRPARRRAPGTGRRGPARARRPGRRRRGTSWVMSMTGDVGRELADHRLHDADELVGGAVVGEERDRWAAGVTADRPAAQPASVYRWPGSGRCRAPRSGTTCRPGPRRARRLDEAVDRHVRDPQLVGDFGHGEEPGPCRQLRHEASPLPTPSTTVPACGW